MNVMPDENEADLHPEYDFTGMRGGVRGKYRDAHGHGHVVRIFKDDGSTEVHYYTLEDGAVMLDPDVRDYFPTSEAVNDALRGLIRIARELNPRG